MYNIQIVNIPSPHMNKAENTENSACKSICKTVHSMAEPYKEVFLLRVLGELSFKEISHIFGKSESWAKVTFFRAKIKVVEKREESI